MTLSRLTDRSRSFLNPGLKNILWGLIALSGLLSAPATVAEDKPLVLAVQPVISENAALDRYRPLARYLSKRLGTPVQLQTFSNFVSYWQGIVGGKHKPDLILDAAHFTGYRATYLGYDIIARVPETISYSLVTTDDQLILDTDELVAKPVATLGAPSMGAMMLETLFPSLFRKPILVEVKGTHAGILKLRSGKVRAAMIPTRTMGKYDDLTIIETSRPYPAPALSAAPWLSDATKSRLRTALLDAANTRDGKLVLERSGIPLFEKANPADYEAATALLEKYWHTGPHVSGNKSF